MVDLAVLDWMVLEDFSNLQDSLIVFSPWLDYGMPGEHSRQAEGLWGVGNPGPCKQPDPFSPWQLRAPLSPSRCSLCLWLLEQEPELSH